jgi:hypothetical protein
MVTLLLAASSASAGDGHNGVPLQKHSYFERDVFIARNGTCNMADQRVIGCVWLLRSTPSSNCHAVVVQPTTGSFTSAESTGGGGV